MSAADFTLANLPYGIVDGRVATRLNDGVVFVGDVVGDAMFETDSLNAFMAAGLDAWAGTRAALVSHLSPPEVALVPVGDVAITLPFVVGDYVDFYSSLHHATNLGRLFRPDSEPLLANWRHVPVGYHGRSGTVVVSGTPVHRPSGLVSSGEGVVRQPSARLDIELEVGFVVGVGGQNIAVDDADAHVFGAVLLNDWSARDIQAFEYQPLGPFLGKSFLTSISPWVVPLDALAPFLVPSPIQNPLPDAALCGVRNWGIDLHLSVERNGTTVSATTFGDLYWSFAQQLAHMTSNGATTRPGDLFASGTVSGAVPGTEGSFIESGTGFLKDGETVVLRGWAGDGPNRVGFGELEGTVIA